METQQTTLFEERKERAKTRTRVYTIYDLHPATQKLITRRSASKWDGHSKYKTLDCESCLAYAVMDNKERCYYGVAFKDLAPREKPKKCEYFRKHKLDDPESIDEIIGKRRGF